MSKPHGTVSGVPFWFIPDQRCPKCGRRHDSASAFDPKQPPEPGAGMYCGGCLTLLVFAEDMKLRLATAEETKTAEANDFFRFCRVFTEIGRDAERRRKGHKA